MRFGTAERFRAFEGLGWRVKAQNHLLRVLGTAGAGLGVAARRQEPNAKRHTRNRLPPVPTFSVLAE